MAKMEALKIPATTAIENGWAASAKIFRKSQLMAQKKMA
jgi:hypothetical protein